MDVLLSPWVDDGSTDARNLQASTVTKSVPIGELIDLYGGALVVDNIVVGDRLLEEFEFEVDFQSDGTKVRRSQIEGATIGADDPRGDTMFLSLPTKCGRQIFIAMAEIFRFYYLSSSILARTVLGPEILEPRRSIYAPKHTSPESESAPARLVVRRGMAKGDVPTIARLVFSPDQVGLKRAKAIYTRSIGEVPKGPKLLAAEPPFVGDAKLRCRGRLTSDAADSPILITKLDSCSGPLYFESLEWRYEDDYKAPPKSKSGKEGKKKKKGRRRIGTAELQFLYLDAGKLPSTDYVSQTFLVDSLDDRFTVLESTQVKRVRLDASGDTRTKNNKPKQGDPLNLTANNPQGNSEVGGGTQATDTVSTHKQDESEGKDPPDSRATPAEVLLHTIDVAEEIARISNATMCDRIVSDKPAQCVGRLFNLFPEAVGGAKRRWLYLDDERATNRRPLLLIEFHANGRYGYLADIVRRGVDSMSLMLLKTIEGGRASQEQLVSFIEVTAAARVEGRQTPAAVLREMELEIVHRRHRLVGSIEDQAKEFCTILVLSS